MDRYPTDQNILAQQMDQKQRHAQDVADTLNTAEGTAPATVFDALYNRINMATDRVHKTAHRIEDIGTRIMGHLQLDKQANDAAGKQSEPDGTLERTTRALACLDQSIERLEIVTDRISNL